MLQHRHIIYCAAFLIDMAVAGVTFAVSRRAAELGASAAALGWLGAMWAAVYTGMVLVTGRLSDRLGRRNVARAGCALAAVMAGACAFTTRLDALLVMMALFGIGLAAFWPSVIAWLTDGGGSPSQLNTRLAHFSVAWNLGLLAGFAQTGWIFARWPQAAFAGATVAIGLVIVLLSLPARPDSPAKAPATVAAPPAIPKGRGFRKTAWLANFALSLTCAGTAALFPLLATSLDISAGVHGVLLALGRGAALVAFLVLPALAFWRSRLWPLWVAQAAAVASIVVFAFASAPWLLALAFIIGGAVSGYTYQASIFFTMEEVLEKGKGSGFHEATLGFGMALGPLLAGWVGQRFSLRAPYWFCAATLSALIVAQMILVFYRRRATVPA